MRPEKESIIKEVRERLETSGYVVLADCSGMKVDGLAELRGTLREQQSTMLFAKNTFIGAASKQMGWSDVEQFLNGPTAVITGDGEVTDVAKSLRKFAKQTSKPVVKGGRFEGATLTDADIRELADMPPREVLLGQVVGTIAAPMSQLVGVMNQKLASVVYVLKAAADKKAASA